jgi:Tol biopolymer transport system component
MSTSTLCGQLGRVFGFSAVNRVPRRRLHFASRGGFIPKLELLECRALLAGVTLTQLTDTAGMGSFSGFSTDPAITGDGTKVVFDSDGDFTGANADHSREIFVFDTLTNSVYQATFAAAGVSSDASVSRDGSRIAFQSDADLTGQNADGNLEIFVFDASSGNVTPATDSTAGDSTGAAINTDGTRVAFASTADLTGDNADGNSEIFVFDLILGGLTQVTDTAEGASSGAAINRDGTRIAFISTADLTGQNADGNAEVFLFDAATSSFTQVTVTAAGESAQLSLDDSGNRLAFESTADPVGSNEDGNREVFWFDGTTGALTQLTGSVDDEFFPGDSSHPSISRDGQTILYDTVDEQHPFSFSRSAFMYFIDSDEHFRVISNEFSSDLTPYMLSNSEDGFRFAVSRRGSIVWMSFDPELYGVSPRGAFATAPYSSSATISGDGQHVAFQSNANQAQDNVDANHEIFVLDTASGGITQVSNAARPRYPFSDHAAANAEGTKVAFDSNQDWAGANGNLNREIFVFDAATGDFTQITDTSVGESTRPSVDDNGARIAFESTADPTGDNADGNREIFLYDAATGGVMQVTDTTGASTFSLGASMSGDGAWISFESTADLTGDNADGNREVFLFEVASGAFTQVTDTADGSSSGAAISQDGTRIAFDSYGDLTGGNADRSREIFLYEVATGAFTQVTDTTGAASSDASINGDGTKVAFSSRADLTGNNADADYEVFLFDAVAGSVTQVTDGSIAELYFGSSLDPSISDDGTRIAFQSYGDARLISVFLYDATTSSVSLVANSLFSADYRPSLSGDGAKVAYTTGAFLSDIVGTTTGSGIELFDVAASEATVVTSAPLPSSAFESGNVTLNEDGSKIVFDSNADLTGHNADRSHELFLYAAAAGSLTQLTDATGRHSVTGNISGDGTKIAFRSHANLTGENADHNFEVFLYNVGTGDLSQLTDTTGSADVGVRSITHEGTKIAFHSQANLTGENADGNYEVFLYDTVAGTVVQVTNTVGGRRSGSESPSLTGDGTKLAFDSTGNLTGQNADANREIFLFDVLSSTFTQVTLSDSGENESPSISDDGTKIAFSSTANLTGDNADGNTEIYLFDAATNQITQVTDGGGEQASISDDGTRISFRSSADLTGQNPDGNAEIFLASVEVEAAMDVHLFYNNSAHDGNGPVVTTADFNAIARDKAPLLLGETASFTSVSGYSRGINGLFLDVPNLPDDGAGIDASDLAFRIGADDFPDTWSAAPAPTSVGVFANAGGGGADRIYVTFADGAVVDTWLGITILATADTGLADATTFCYGSVPAETGAAFVGQGQFFGRDAADLQSIAIDLFHSADIENPNDLNRDGRVDAFDLQVIPVAGGGRIQANVLRAITPQPGPPPLALPAVDEAMADGPEIPFPPAGQSLGGPNTAGGPAIPRDERVDGGDPAPRDLAFATFFHTPAGKPLGHGLFAALVRGRM